MTNDSSDASLGPRFQILALDGGGAKGLFAAHALACLEDDFDIRIQDKFDLILGTSTGGIIALGLGAGLRPADIASHYQELTERVFPKARRNLFRRVFRGIRSRYDQDALRASLVDILGTRLLGHSTKRLVIPSYDLETGCVHVFKTPHHSRFRRDWKNTMVDVALATSAAPTYLPVAKVDQHRLIDGGIWANNPSVLGIAEAVSTLQMPLSSIHVLNMGTLESVIDAPPSLDNAGIAGWVKSGLQVLIGAGTRGDQGVADHLLRYGAEPDQTRYSRFDVTVPVGIFSLDDAPPKRLMAQASQAARHFEPTFRTRFLDHEASAYFPSIDVSPLP